MDLIHVWSGGVVPVTIRRTSWSFQLVVKVCFIYRGHVSGLVPGGFCLWRLETESYSWFPGLPFNVVLIQFVDSCNFITITVMLFYVHFHSYTFFAGRYHTSCLSTDEWFFLFPGILVVQVLVGALGNTPPIMGAWGWGHLGCYSLLLDFVHLRVVPGILHIYGRTTLFHRFAFWVRIFATFSPTLFLWRESDVHWLHRHLHRFWIYYTLFQVWTSTCGFLLSGILHGATFLI